MKKILLTFLCLASIFSSVLKGCERKYFFDYGCNWESEDPYIYINIEQHTAMIDINGESTEVRAGWENNGIGILFHDINTGEEIKYVNTEVKDGKLYIRNLYEDGDEYVLEQVDSFEEE